jgi:hypothetical protein
MKRVHDKIGAAQRRDAINRVSTSWLCEVPKKKSAKREFFLEFC